MCVLYNLYGCHYLTFKENCIDIRHPFNEGNVLNAWYCNEI